MAVHQLSFQVEEGEVFGLLGPNGAGKTTTIRVLACLISPSKGSASVSKYSISENPLAVRKTVGILTENPSLYERLTAQENMDFFAQAYDLTEPQEKADRIKELLRFFNLWERKNDKVGTFSKGMKQKLAIARALVHKPPVLLLDEPTAGLDPESAKEVRDLMKRLTQQEKHTILICTHRLEDAEKLCSRVMIINQGKSIAIGTPDQLRDKIANKPTVRIDLRNIDSKIVKAIQRVSYVEHVEASKSSSKLTVVLNDIDLGIPEVVKSIVNNGGLIHAVYPLRPSLEDAYLKMIRKKQE
jgi:ABC-2 type transport system ATP-binding protein